MKREDAIKLLGDLADAGIPCGLSIHPTRSRIQADGESEICTVSISGHTYERIMVEQLLDFADLFGCVLVMFNGQMQFVPDARSKK